jgi:hypothetical protein
VRPSAESTPRPLWIALLTALAVLAWLCRDTLNTDAVAYLRIAHYWAAGNTALAINGYPLVIAARLVMVLSALVFFTGAARLLRVGGLTGAWLHAGQCAMAACAAGWSVHFITPDLLMAGLVLLALSEEGESRASNLRAGAWWAAAFLAKAVALPLALLSVPLIAVWKIHKQKIPIAVALRQTATTLALLLLLVAPWVALLTAHHGKLTFATSPAIAHAVAGPRGAEAYHPFARGLHEVEPGRVTQWENPSRMEYPDWLRAPGGVRHQLLLLAKNLALSLALLATISPALLPLLLWWWRGGVASPDPRAWIPLGVLILLYLPGWLDWQNQRFFFVAAPLLFLCVADAFARVAANARTAQLAATSFILPALVATVWIAARTQTAGVTAHDVATRLLTAGIVGPVAGSASLPGGRTGLYVAFHIGQPWLGDPFPRTGNESTQSPPIRLVILRRGDPWPEILWDASHRSLDAVLHPAGDAAQCPIEVHEIIRAGTDSHSLLRIRN